MGLSEYEARGVADPGECDECALAATSYGSLPAGIGAEVPWRACDEHVPTNAPWREPIGIASL